MFYDLIIRNARLEDGDMPVDIGMKDGNILVIGTIASGGPEHSGQTEIDAGNKLVIPGFVNSHTHLDKADLLSRMRPDQFGGTLDENRRLIREFKENYTIPGMKERAGNVVREMVRQGTTAIRTQVDIDLTAKLLPLTAICELKEEYDGIVDMEICAFPQEGVLKPGTRELLEEALTPTDHRLKGGADLLGGLPLVEKTGEEQKRHINILFEIAKKHDRGLEVQIDESNDPEDFMLPYLAQKTIEEGYEGRVSATHCISLSKVCDETARETIEKVKEAGINIIVTPSCNLITNFPDRQGFRPYNSITRVKDLVENGINVAMGTDNIRDIFYPLGNGSMIREMHVLATTTRMSGIEDIAHLLSIASLNGARIMGLDYGVVIGRRADLLVTNSATKRGVISGQEIIPYVVKNGRVVSQSQLTVESLHA